MTKDWPPASGACPQISLERQTLEAIGAKITFGDPVENARFLGRPDERTFTEGVAQLGYSNWGLTLEFEHGRFVEAAFDLEGPLAEQRDNPFASTKLKGPDGFALTRQTSKAELLQRFGQPTKTQDVAGDETVLHYQHGPLVSELHLDDEGLLLVWSVYLDN